VLRHRHPVLRLGDLGHLGDLRHLPDEGRLGDPSPVMERKDCCQGGLLGAECPCPVRPRTGCCPDEEFLGLRHLAQLGPPSLQEQVKVKVHPALPEPQG
jgi:hypothetical protein